MKNVRLILVSIIIISLLVGIVSAVGVRGKVIDDSAKAPKVITNVPLELKNKISIAGGDSSYSVTKDKIGIRISKADAKDTHTKTKCSIDVSTIKALSGYNGKEFSVLNVVDGQVTGFKIIKTKDALKGKNVTFDATFSEVIISGMTGSYSKTVSINTLNTTIPFAVTGATGLNVLIDSPGTYIAFNESNISTYPNPSYWLVVWPLNGNANDISGNYMGGSVVGVTSTAGRSGVSDTGYYFDGDNDYITCNYPEDALYPYCSVLVGYKLNHSELDSNHVVVDFRNASGIGRTAMYEYENAYYVNNATSTVKLNSTTNMGWKYATYPSSSFLVNLITLGNRYSLVYDYKGWIDLFGIYRGYLDADKRRVFSYGYQGITVAPYPTTTRTPIRSSNQTVTPPSTITGVNIQSPNSSTKTVTLVAYLQQNATLVREWDNATHRHVDIRFTAGSNISSGSIAYELASSDAMRSVAMESNDSTASVSLDDDVIYIDVSNLTTGQTKYYNVSMEMSDIVFTLFQPTDTTPYIGLGGSQVFAVAINNTADVNWLVNGSVEYTDYDATILSRYTYESVASGDYNITARAIGDQQSWILTVGPDPAMNWTPSSASPKIKNDTIEQFKVSYVYPVSVTWLLDNVTQRTDNDTDVTSYWFNASDVSIHNITARMTGAQKTWTVNVTATPRSGNGALVTDAIIVSSFILATSLFWGRFRRKF